MKRTLSQLLCTLCLILSISVHTAYADDGEDHSSDSSSESHSDSDSESNSGEASESQNDNDYGGYSEMTGPDGEAAISISRSDDNEIGLSERTSDGDVDDKYSGYYTVERKRFWDTDIRGSYLSSAVTPLTQFVLYTPELQNPIPLSLTGSLHPFSGLPQVQGQGVYDTFKGYLGSGTFFGQISEKNQAAWDYSGGGSNVSATITRAQLISNRNFKTNQTTVAQSPPVNTAVIAPTVYSPGLEALTRDPITGNLVNNTQHDVVIQGDGFTSFYDARLTGSDVAAQNAALVKGIIGGVANNYNQGNYATSAGFVVLGGLALGGEFSINPLGTSFERGAIRGAVGAAVKGEAKNSVTLYRAVSPAELDSIRKTGQFVSPYGIESKYFTTSGPDAANYARQAVYGFRDEPYTIVRTTVPNNLLNVPGVKSQTGIVDGGIPTYVIPNEHLPNLRPEIMNYSPLPSSNGWFGGIRRGDK